MAINNIDNLVSLEVEEETVEWATLEFHKSVRKFSIEAAVQVNLSNNGTDRSLCPKNKEEHSLADILSEDSLDKIIIRLPSLNHVIKYNF